MYDKDGSGSIELPEMIEIIGTLYEMEGVSKVREPLEFQHFYDDQLFYHHGIPSWSKVYLTQKTFV
jgi:hypothetical protein